MTYTVSPYIESLICKQAEQEKRDPVEVLHRSVLLYTYLNSHIDNPTDEIAIVSAGKLKKILKGLLSTT